MSGFRMIKMDNGGENIDLPKGEFYLLAIGINEYLHHSNLKTAVNDATKFSELMQSQYGFKKENCTLLTDNDATADKINLSIREYLPTGSNPLTDEDFLLVWFSGHGEDDEFGTQRTYIVPHDGKANKQVTSWIDYDLIKGYLGNIDARQILLISDSCFSGGALREIDAEVLDHTNQYYSNVAKFRGRQVLTSGGLEAVQDVGFNGHSVFADAVISFLSNQQNLILAASEIFHNVKHPISLNAEQTPRFGNLFGAGSHGGEFLLFNTKAKEEDVLLDPETFSHTDTFPLEENSNLDELSEKTSIDTNTSTVKKKHDYFTYAVLALVFYIFFINAPYELWSEHQANKRNYFHAKYEKGKIFLKGNVENTDVKGVALSYAEVSFPEIRKIKLHVLEGQKMQVPEYDIYTALDSLAKLECGEFTYDKNGFDFVGVAGDQSIIDEIESELLRRESARTHYRTSRAIVLKPSPKEYDCTP